MSSTATVIDLTESHHFGSSDDEAGGQQHSCAICQRSENLVPSPCAYNSIQCNPQLATLGKNFEANTYGEHQAPGCNAWFHKTCLKKWHLKCTTNTEDEHPSTTCPLCRAQNTFVWSYARDYGLEKCIYYEDFVQHAVASGLWDAVKVNSVCDEYGISLAYHNRPEKGRLPYWVNASRKHGCILSNAVVGNDLATVKYLVYHGAYIPGTEIDPLDEDSPPETMEPMDEFLPILLLAVKQYAVSDMRDLCVFKFLLDITDIREHEYAQKVLYPHVPDAFLYAISHGLEAVVRLMLPLGLKKHPWPMLLQLCLSAGVIRAFPVLPVLIGGMQHHEQVVRLENALLEIQGCQGFSGSIFDLVYSYMPRELKVCFLVGHLKTCMISHDYTQFAHVLFRPGSDLPKLGFEMAHANDLLISLSAGFHSNYITSFTFQRGLTRKAIYHSNNSFRRLLNSYRPSTLADSTHRRSKKWPFTSASALLLRRKPLINALHVMKDIDYASFNALELLLLFMHVNKIKSTVEVIHGVLYRGIRMIYERKLDRMDTEMVCKRILLPLIIFEPECIDCMSVKTNALLYCAEKGMSNTFDLLFLNREPKLDQIKNESKQGCLHLVLLHGHFKMASTILAKLMAQELLEEVNAKDANGRTPLMLCSMFKLYGYQAGKCGKRKRDSQKRQERDMIFFISEYLKFDFAKQGINEQDKDGNTALHLAYQSDNQKLIVALEQEEAVDLTIRNKAGRFPSEAKVQ